MEQRTLSDYQVIKSIGQGTLGMVYLAEHRFMKRQYVLKVLPEELSSDRLFIQRFEEEVSILSTLEHPNIVRIHTVSFDQGRFFLVTDCIVDEFGETTNLGQYISALGRRLEEEEIFKLLKQVAEALDYAHSKKGSFAGLAHRGIKLNNILVGKGKGAVDLYLSDFGLSRVIGSGAVLTRTYKTVAEALGIATPPLLHKAGQDRYPSPPIDTAKLIPLHTSFLQNYAFLAPEQKRLDTHHPVDTKVDAYAFGVLTYYLLMGELPEGIFDMPSTKGEYRYAWDGLLQRCLQTIPSRRPENLVEVLEAVKARVTPQTASKKIQPESKAPTEAKAAVESKVQPAVVDVGTPQEALAAFKPRLHSPQLERPKTDIDPAAALIVDPTVKAYNPEARDVTNIKPILTEMVVINGDTFYRGSQDGNRDEMPRHPLTIPSFAVDIHPVTNEQFVRFLEVMGGEKDSHHNDIIRLRDSRIKRSGGKLSIESGYAKHPVVGVTWYGAVAYAKWVGKRLPTEAEWEIAARGGVESALYPTGDDIEKTQANFFSSDTTAVMSYAPNGYGLYDMAGNVYEWCHDWYGYNYYEVSMQEPDNPQGPLQGVYRVLRGGCWKSLREDLRCSRRHRNNPGTVNGTYGFRCTADVQLA